MSARRAIGGGGTLLAIVALLSGCATSGGGQPSGTDILKGVLSGYSVGGVNVGAAAGVAMSANDAMREIPEPEEIQMGNDIAAALLGAAPLVDNRAQQVYVNDVGRWLALHSARPDLPWKFGILDTDSINAFATPGGNVFLSRGLVMQMHSESELAGVLAHEISHVVLKHHLKDIQKNATKNMALDLASLKAGGLVGEAAQAVARVGMEGFVRGLSREDEMQADRLGVVIAARAGYDPYGLPIVLQDLAALPQDESAMGQFLHTHPAPTERLAALEAIMPASWEAWSIANPALAGRFARTFPGQGVAAAPAAAARPAAQKPATPSKPAAKAPAKTATPKPVP
ncbi:MAG: M48 family metalloprotease [Proteobacteria bacterium]|nr:M48 family metalloprotease [Pseudomonadota bacterium]